MRHPSLGRRNLVAGLVVAGSSAFVRPLAASATASIADRLSDLERRYGGMLGVAILDTGTSGLVSHRGGERFPICSVGKLPAVALLLARVDAGEERLDRRVAYSASDLVAYSPRTRPALATGLTLAALCEASITLSDNTAHNLIFDAVGGPPAVTTFLRRAGDHVTRADRREPELNDVSPTDVRDTTTPVAMARFMRVALTGDLLTPASRDQLSAWLMAAETGGKRLRSALPAGWRAGDKTGSGARNATNDVAILYPPGRAPVIVTAFYVDSPAEAAARERVLAAVGRIAATT